MRQLPARELFTLQNLEVESQGSLTMSLEQALRLFHAIQTTHPEIGPLQLPIASFVETSVDTASAYYRAFVKTCLGVAADIKIQNMAPESRQRYLAYTLSGLPDFGYYLSPVPNLEDLRNTYPEGSYPRYLLELELRLVRVKVKDCLQSLYRKIFSPFEVDPSSHLKFLRKQLLKAVEDMGIQLDHIKIQLFEVNAGEVVDEGIVLL